MTHKQPFNPTKSEPLWPPLGTPMFPAAPGYPLLPPLPPLPPCPVVLGDCRPGDRVLLASGALADVDHVSPAGVRLRPVDRTSRTVFDSKTGTEVTFTVRKAGYLISGSATCQAVVEHNAPEIEAEAEPSEEGLVL